MPDHQHPPLHPNIHIHPPTPSLLPAYKRLITTLLPIPYPPQFYTASLPPFTDSFALVAIWQSDPITSTSTPAQNSTSPSQQQSEVVIGGIQARIEDQSAPSSRSLEEGNNGDGGEKVLYIQTLAVLAPYRGLGVGKDLLEGLIEMVLRKEEGVREVYAHVWEANEEGVEWYVKRGFVVVGGVVERYYRRLRPQGAVVVRRRFGVGDWVRVDKIKGSRREEGL